MPEKPHLNILQLFDDLPLVKVCAPMVRYSKLQFRNLVKKYDCDLMFTPMILADSFCKSSKARNNEFTTNLLDLPVVVQFAANRVADFVGASYLVSPHCDGVDLNCGCPQKWANDMKIGCAMLKNPQLIFDLVRECRNKIAKPFTVSVKTRLKKDLKETVKIFQQLEHCGVSFLTVHARTAEDKSAPINMEALKIITESIHIPIIGNGGLNHLDNCYKLKDTAGVKGTMVANKILTNPEFFTAVETTSIECVQNWLDICFNSTLTFEAYEKLAKSAKENNTFYGTISEKPFNLTFQCFHHHLVFMLEKILTRKQRQEFNNLKKFSTVQDFLYQQFNLRPKLYCYEDFKKSELINLNYTGRDAVYKDLKGENRSEIFYNNYDTSIYNGKYFDDRIFCDYSDIFLESEEICK